jgi:single stranded DNA-binding protein
MSTYSRTELLGRLGADIESKTSSGGKDYASFSVAVDRYMGPNKDKETVWHNVTCFGQTAKFLGEKAKTGMLVLAIGEYIKEEYEKDGDTKVSYKLMAAEVKLLGYTTWDRPAGYGSGTKTTSSQKPGSTKTAAASASTAAVTDDDIPF